MIDYSPKAQYARALLLRKYNDILVFVEDPSLQFMYVRIVNILLGGAGKVEHVFGLGGRAAVVEACLRNPFVGAKPSAYLIDGDLDLLTGGGVPPSPRLHRLDAYSVENLLMSESAVGEIAAESAGSRSKQEVTAELKFDALAVEVTKLLLPLFVVYAVVARLNLSIETVKYAVVRLCASATDARSLSRTLIRRRIREVRRAIVALAGHSTYRATWRTTAGNARSLSAPLRAISGKSYLLPLLSLLLSKEYKCRDSAVSLRSRLAMHIDRNKEQALSDFLVRAVGKT